MLVRPASSFTAIFYLCSPVVERKRELSEVSFMWALIPFMRVPPSRAKHLSKAPLPHTITLGVRISAYEQEEGTDIQTIATIYIYSFEDFV